MAKSRTMTILQFSKTFQNSYVSVIIARLTAGAESPRRYSLTVAIKKSGSVDPAGK